MEMLSRREWIGRVSIAIPLCLDGLPLWAEGADRSKLGIGMHSYGMQWSAARQGSPAKFQDALSFLQYCRTIGAGGVQVAIGAADARTTAAIRATAESAGMYVEGQLSLPGKPADQERFEAEVRAAKDAGADVIRTALLGGRRYETFASAEAFQEFAKRSWEWVVVAEPILKKHRMRLAIENHKDRRVPELVDLLERLSSEYVGVCVDTGNSIALLEDPLEVVEAYAPWAFSTHLKDMAVDEYEEGFLLAEAPLGDGFLDLKKIISTLRHASPRVRFLLEMITRDPLKVPCLTPRYWTTMGAVNGSELARTLTMVRGRKSSKPLPRLDRLSRGAKLELEDANVRRSLEFAKRSLAL